MVLVWFAPPLLRTLGSLTIGRVEIHPYTHWASPVGQRLLGAAAPTRDGHDNRDGRGDHYGRDALASVAVRGVGALSDPGLRVAFAHRTTHRGQ